MSTLLAVATFLVVLFCLERAVGAIGSPHDRDLDAWHVVMGTAMLMMLVAPLPRPVAVATLALGAAGLAWSTVRLLRRSAPGPYLRLALGWVAMLVMVVPVVAAAPATAGSGAGHQHAAAAAGAGEWVSPALLVVGLLVALAAVLLLRLAVLVRPSTRPTGRWDACCDVVMAAGAGSMLLMLV